MSRAYPAGDRHQLPWDPEQKCGQRKRMDVQALVQNRCLFQKSAVAFSFKLIPSEHPAESLPVALTPIKILHPTVHFPSYDLCLGRFWHPSNIFFEVLMNQLAFITPMVLNLKENKNSSCCSLVFMKIMGNIVGMLPVLSQFCCLTRHSDHLLSQPFINSLTSHSKALACDLLSEKINLDVSLNKANQGNNFSEQLT